MKKLLIIILMINLAILVFSQETVNSNENIIKQEYPKNILAINIGYLMQAFRDGRTGFGLGVMYEHSLNNYFSMFIESGGIWYVQKNSIERLQFDITGYGRFYPQGTSLAKFFLGLGMGYSLVNIKYNKAENSHLFKIIPELGYKYFWNKGILELGFGYRFDFGEINYPNGIVGKSDKNILSNIQYRILGGFILNNREKIINGENDGI